MNIIKLLLILAYFSGVFSQINFDMYGNLHLNEKFTTIKMINSLGNHITMIT